jgi:hypothetical protein
MCLALLTAGPLMWPSAVSAAPAKAADKAVPAAVATTHPAWPPVIPHADANGVITLSDPAMLEIPDQVAAAAKETGFKFIVAKTPPVVDLVYHNHLPDQGVGLDNGTGWTAWGDICVASDGSVYVGIGDHGRDGTRLKPGQKSDANAFIYRWFPAQKKLVQIININALVHAGPDDPNWSKVHSGILQGAKGNIYITPTFNDGQRSKDVHWTQNVPCDQIIQYNPKTNQATIIGQLPANSATATSELDPKRNILYYNLEGIHKNALFAFDLNTMKPVYQGPDGMIGQNRNIAQASDGSLYFNAPDLSLHKYDPDTHELSYTGITFPDGSSMRSSTRQASDGWIYATTYGGHAKAGGHLVRFNPDTQKIEDFGPEFPDVHSGSKGKVTPGNYTAVTVLSPDEKFVYYLPGSHGGAVRIGCPVVQYNIATGQRKVLAFLQPVVQAKAEYVPGGTYGVKISEDGSTLYVNFNGHAVEKNRLPRMKPNGFGLTAFAAIHIPESER